LPKKRKVKILIFYLPESFPDTSVQDVWLYTCPHLMIHLLLATIYLDSYNSRNILLCFGRLSVLSKFYYQLMHKKIALKVVLKCTLKQLQHVSLYSPSSGSALYEFAKATILNRQLKYIGVVNLVLWLHVLSGPWWCMSAHSSEPVKKSLCIVVYFFFNYILLQAAVRFQWLWRLKLWLTSEAQMPFEVWTIFTSFLCSYFSVSVGREKYSYVDTTR